MRSIYWANGIFGEADRHFNARCVQALRDAGYTVINPQDSPFNVGATEPTAAEIFGTDTRQVGECDVLVACLDQETIDAGVACEVGIAWALQKQIYGLYTDFRQNRDGPYRMYKNPYVIGCIESRGRVLRSLDTLLEELRRGSQ